MKYLIIMTGFLIFSYIVCCTISHCLGRKKFCNAPLSVDLMQAAKGFAIVIIMAGHIGNLFGVRFLNPLGSLGVAMFLFASGYGLQLSFLEKGLSKFWSKKVLKVWIPYVLIETIACIFWRSDVTARMFLEDVFLLSPMHPYGWYMQCLFIYYAVFSVSAKIFPARKYIRYIIIAIAGMTLFLFFRSVFKQQAISFLLGVICGANSDIAKKYVQKPIVCILSLISGVAMLAIKQLPVVREGPEVMFFAILLLQATLLMIAVISAFNLAAMRFPKAMFTPLIFVGSIAYELYLIHAFVMPSDITAVRIIAFS